MQSRTRPDLNMQLAGRPAPTAGLDPDGTRRVCPTLARWYYGPEDPGYEFVAGKIEEILRHIRTNSLLEQADTLIRNEHYTKDMLEIERLSGERLSMDQCYINLALVHSLPFMTSAW